MLHRPGLAATFLSRVALQLNAPCSIRTQRRVRGQANSSCGGSASFTVNVDSSSPLTSAQVMDPHGDSLSCVPTCKYAG